MAEFTSARHVFEQSNGEVTRAYYAALEQRGPFGKIAVALFRAQKTSTRAKLYRSGKYRSASYSVKSWSMGEATRLLTNHGTSLGFKWGWKEDPSVPFGERPSQVLYCDIPGFGQCSFHSPERGDGPEYLGGWDRQHASEARILAFCDWVIELPIAQDRLGEERAPSSGVPQKTSTVCGSHTEGVSIPAESMPLEYREPKLVFGDPASIRRVRARG